MNDNSDHPASNLFYLLIGLAVWIPLLLRTFMDPPPRVMYEPARIVQAVATPVTEPATATAAPLPVAVGNSENGKTLYSSTCVACHGASGEGVKGLGKDLITSEFIPSQTDDEMATFVKRGRDMSDPLNTTGIAMPPKGGNPALTDEQIMDIVAYLRSIHR